MRTVYAIGFVISVIVWIYTTHRNFKYRDSITYMWIALAFIWICVLGFDICG